mmetsp:Transcript_40357/g.86667  ORF Transcript_40357/g.86667 Transcript_40357/m.86667 type:complete len:225 (+) Transcript_40357:906-1580(+)
MMFGDILEHLAPVIIGLGCECLSVAENVIRQAVDLSKVGSHYIMIGLHSCLLLFVQDSLLGLIEGLPLGIFKLLQSCHSHGQFLLCIRLIRERLFFSFSLMDNLALQGPAQSLHVGHISVGNEVGLLSNFPSPATMTSEGPGIGFQVVSFITKLDCNVVTFNFLQDLCANRSALFCSSSLVPFFQLKAFLFPHFLVSERLIWKSCLEEVLGGGVVGLQHHPILR